MQCDNNTKFLLAWLPVFAVDPPTEKECKAGQATSIPSYFIYITCFFCGSPNIQEVLAKVAQDQRMTLSKDKEDIGVTLHNILKIANHFQTVSHWHNCLGLVSDRRQLAQSIGFKSAKCLLKDRKTRLGANIKIKWLRDWITKTTYYGSYDHPIILLAGPKAATCTS